MPSLPINHKDLKEFLESAFPESIVHVSDRNYAFVSEDFLLAFAKRLLKSLQRKGLYYGPKWDCDNFSRHFVDQVCIKHAQSTIEGAEGVAVGWVDYFDYAIGRHMLVWFLTPDLKLKFIEPQEGTITELSVEERETRCYVMA